MFNKHQKYATKLTARWETTEDLPTSRPIQNVLRVLKFST